MLEGEGSVPPHLHTHPAVSCSPKNIHKKRWWLDELSAKSCLQSHTFNFLYWEIRQTLTPSPCALHRPQPSLHSHCFLTLLATLEMFIKPWVTLPAGSPAAEQPRCCTHPQCECSECTQGSACWTGARLCTVH